ncbi:hypothetical protein EKO27_g6034 [Xylaria grammica]|uniref:Uncharacterized protein n=1 Tax=Xylaria grammica TaxID=363999 RepID=A0A439D3W2_9PEZI|nr:hypothetical protein EKO27_g6034 [Xylaria grammica]
MDLDTSLEALDLGALQNMPLKDLEAKIHQSAAANLSRSEIFDVLMRWFNEQIKRDAINQSKYPLECFVKLLHMYNHTDIEPFSLTQVDEVLNGWLEKGAIQNSTYRRRYLIIQQDLHHLFANERRNSQNSGASSPFDCHHGPKEIHSPGLSFKQEDNGMKREKEDAVLPHDMDHSTRISAAGQFVSLTSAGTVEIDKPVQLPDMEHMDVVFPQLLSDTQSQDAGADDVIMAPETTVIDSSGAKMSRKSTRNRGRKPKFHRDAPEPYSPPKNYICKRCNKPGEINLTEAVSFLTDSSYRALDSVLPDEPRSSLRPKANF